MKSLLTQGWNLLVQMKSSLRSDEIKSTHPASSRISSPQGISSSKMISPTQKGGFRWKRLWLYHNQSLFLAGAQGLEPWAYGFGDDADKSASGELPFEVIISTIQKKIAATSAKSYQKQNKLGTSKTSLRSSESTICWVETVGSEIIPQNTEFINSLPRKKRHFYLSETRFFS